MSRIESIIADVEAGKPVDLKKASLLMALDAAVADARFVKHMAEVRSDADERLLHR